MPTSHKPGCSLRSALLLLALLIIAGGLTWQFALTSLDRDYALRLIRMGQSDVQDYLRFPERAIANPAQPSPLVNDPHPEWFTQITYTVDGEPQQSSVDELMERTRTQALIILQSDPAGGDRILYEKYYNGYTRDSIVTSFSSAKSFNSALIGFAIADGLIGSVDDRMVQYLPELAGRGLDEMTIRDLLLMSSGIAYREDENMIPLLGAPFSDDALTYYYPDLRRIALQRVRAGDEPVGERFHYNNYHPILEGMILERVTGMHVAEYLEEKIWLPLGMEYPASWSLDSAATAFEKMESGLNGRAIDFARFGLLFLHAGNRRGQQLLPAEWVRESTGPDPQDRRPWSVWPEYPKGGGYYRYHWWGHVRADGHYDFSAAGHLGQYIYVCPQKSLVIARYGEDEAGVDSYWDVLYALEELVP